MNKNLVIIVIIVFAVIVGLPVYINDKASRLGSKAGNFSTAAQGSPVSSPKIISLKNGDVYDLSAGIVRKKIAGQEVKMLSYNGSIPGPIIRVQQGAEITINFKNETDVETTIHSHGVRVENKFDGVPDITQEVIKPGRSFVYKLKFPDAGIYWYHPHVREDYAQELGLYGNFIVTPRERDYWAEVDREEFLFLDDILITNGQIAPFSKSTVDHALMGRFGNVMLVNARDDFKLSIKQGERVRFYITNAANTRVFNFSIPSAQMRLTGGDNGKYEREEWVDSIILGPSERAIVEIWFENSGEYQILNKTPQKTYTMGSISVEPRPVTVSYLLIPRINQDFINSLSPLRPLFSKAPDKTLNLTIDMMGNMMGSGSGSHMMPDGAIMGGNMMGDSEDDKIDWENTMGMMNAMATNKTLKWKLVDDATKKENMDIEWKFKKGDKVKIKLFNDPDSGHPMQHPIHIHGQRFLVTATNGAPTSNLAWKDTVLVQNGDKIELLVDMENPGTWLIHCHIPEHMEAGMMSLFKVI